MRRTNIYLSDEQLERLDARAREAGVSRAELIRELLDAGLRGEAGDRLEADLAAITDAYGTLGGSVEDVDRSDGAREAHLARLWAGPA